MAITAISPNSIFTSTMTIVDQAIGNSVQTAYQSLVSNNMTEITMLFTVFVVMVGYPFLVRSATADIHVLIKRLILMTIVYGLIINWSLYNTFFYNVFTHEPDQLSSILSKAINPDQVGTNGGAAQSLDSVFDAGKDIANNFMRQASLANIPPAIYALLVMVVNIISCVLGLCLLIYAKLALAVILGIGPIFVMFLLWDGTRGLFDAWVRNALNFALIPIITTGILTMMITIENAALATNKNSTVDTQFINILPFLCIGLTAFFILRQVLPICASLSGGVALANVGEAFKPVSNGIRKIFEKGKSGGGGSGGKDGGKGGDKSNNERKRASEQRKENSALSSSVSSGGGSSASTDSVGASNAGGSLVTGADNQNDGTDFW